VIQKNPQANAFKQKLRDSLKRETLNSSASTVEPKGVVYSRGDRDEKVYFIESGQIKLLMLAAGGKQCILAIHAAGDIFGEICLSGLGARAETAVAMQKTVLKEIPCAAFFTCLIRDALVEGFVRYLAVRVADQQKVISNLVMVDSEQRLGQALLQLGRTMGKKDPTQHPHRA
jgi:CRP/FNR family transcriptional regulator, cyclic AMP receptor protein